MYRPFKTDATTLLHEESLHKSPANDIRRNLAIATADVLVPCSSLQGSTENIMQTLEHVMSEQWNDITIRPSGIKVGATPTFMTLISPAGRNMMVNLDIKVDGTPTLYKTSDGKDAYLLSCILDKNKDNLVDIDDALEFANINLGPLALMGAQKLSASLQAPEQDTPALMDVPPRKFPETITQLMEDSRMSRHLLATGVIPVDKLTQIGDIIHADMEDWPLAPHPGIIQTLATVVGTNLPQTIIKTEGTTLTVQWAEDVPIFDVLDVKDKYRTAPKLEITTDGLYSGQGGNTNISKSDVIIAMMERSPAAKAKTQELESLVSETLRDCCHMAPVPKPPENHMEAEAIDNNRKEAQLVLAPSMS